MAAITPPSEILISFCSLIGSPAMKGARATAPESLVGASGLGAAGDEAGGDALDRPLLPFEIVGADRIAEIDGGRGDENVGGADGLLDRFHLARTGHDLLGNPGCAQGRGKGDARAP